MTRAPVGELVLLGWPADGPTLRLDHRRFSYAGKFVMSTTGKAVVREPPGGAAPDPAAPTGDGAGDDPLDDTDIGAGGDAWADHVLAAAAFNEHRTDADVLWIRYLTVREDHRGEGLGPALCDFVARAAAERAYGTVRIAVNNPFAYEACYRAGFAYTGDETGIAELVLERPADEAAMLEADRSPDRYHEGLAVFADRDLSSVETEFLGRKRGGDPPEPTV